LACHVPALDPAEWCIASIILPIKELKRLVLICLHLAKNAITIAGDIKRLSMC
jgi:hypothetical protein